MADVCLIVEGSYPYISGGVASWTHDLIVHLPDLTFDLVTILPNEQFKRIERYDVPRNVLSRQDLFLFAKSENGKKRIKRSLFEELKRFHTLSNAECGRSFSTFFPLLPSTLFSSIGSRQAWQLLLDRYEAESAGNSAISFLDYFWTWRSIHVPMFRLLDAKLPRAAVYHTLSTGYAGLLAAIAKHRHGGSLLMTEHGIYSRERAIEIQQADWIFHQTTGRTAIIPQESAFKRIWMRLYRRLGQLAYDHADQIVTLFQGNQELQLQHGAAEEKLAVMQNGIDASRFQPLRGRRDWADRPFRVALIGRVVPIKDVKTFVRAIHLVQLEIPVEAYVLGPTDESPEYYEECLELSRFLGLEGLLHFTGSIDLKEWLPRIDLTVLTSVSEAQPLVILEAGAAGVPAVASDVGDCRGMLGGKLGEDALLGPSGIVTPVASPEATAAAILSLARDPERYRRMAEAASARVERFYRIDRVYEFYRQAYRSLSREG